MSKRVLTVMISLSLLAAACGADPDPSSGAPSDQPPTTAQASSDGAGPEGTTTTSSDNAASPSPADDERQPEDAAAPTTTTSAVTIPPSGSVDVGDGKVIEVVPVEGTVPPAVGEAPASLMDAVMADLSTLTGAPASTFVVVRAESVLWNDGALGCPEPGGVYTQATVAGYWIVIAHAGTEYDYRANDGGYFVRCASGSPPSGDPTK